MVKTKVPYLQTQVKLTMWAILLVETRLRTSLEFTFAHIYAHISFAHKKYYVCAHLEMNVCAHF